MPHLFWDKFFEANLQGSHVRLAHSVRTPPPGYQKDHFLPNTTTSRFFQQYLPNFLGGDFFFEGGADGWMQRLIKRQGPLRRAYFLGISKKITGCEMEWGNYLLLSGRNKLENEKYVSGDSVHKRINAVRFDSEIMYMRLHVSALLRLSFLNNVPVKYLKLCHIVALNFMELVVYLFLWNT
ncbi:hypothetical protein TNCV_789121 [Trichonephila clavipes]|nr:hypothetical protein TNCV_789121 [Trichonephila clavipes]